MRKQQDSPGEFDIRRAMELAATPAGQQLLALLQAQNSADLQKAMTLAAAGDYKSAQQSLSMLLDQPEVRSLLEHLEG